jgi:uncharacterized protein YkvS
MKERENEMKKAEIGNIVEFKDGLKGVVEKVNENSVIVDLTYMDNYRDLDLDRRTVVNHKNYTIVENTIQEL